MRAEKSRVGAIIVAAGSSQRMGQLDKLFADLAGKPVLARVIDVFQACPSIDQIVVVLGEKNLEQGQKLVKEHGWSKVIEVCQGGSRRQDSVQEGLKRLGECSWVVVHDGARPCLSIDLIERGLVEAAQGGSAIAAVPVKDTIKMVGLDRVIQETPNRDRLWAAQTPQVFQYDLLAEAYRVANNEVTDDAMLLEQSGHRVKVYMGSYDNIKVTTPEDLVLAQVFLSRHSPHT